MDACEPWILPGDALVFDGRLLHLGLENGSRHERYFFYASYSTRRDPNAEAE